MQVKKWKLTVFLLPCVCLFALVYLVPLLMVVGTSFFEWKAGGVLRFVGLQNYITAFTKDARMVTALRNTAVWVLLQSTVHVGIGTVIAFLLAKKLRGWKALRTIYMLPNVVSAAALGVIFLNVFNPKYGLLNAMIRQMTGAPFQKNWFFDPQTAFITVTWSWLLYTGMIIIVVLAGILAIPEELIEAARMDGASEMQIHLKVRLPLLHQVLGTAVILAATSMLREFELIYLTTNGGPGDATLNLPLYLYKTSMTDNNYGYANMMGVVLMVAGVFAVQAIHKIFHMHTQEGGNG